jgi:hypothetical protein
VPEIPENEAVIVVCPVATAVTFPLEVTVATDGKELDHMAVAETSLVDPSLYFAVAVSCWLCPARSDVVPETATDVTFGCTGCKGPLDELLLHPAPYIKKRQSRARWKAWQKLKVLLIPLAVQTHRSRWMLRVPDFLNGRVLFR